MNEEFIASELWDAAAAQYGGVDAGGDRLPSWDTAILDIDYARDVKAFRAMAAKAVQLLGPE